MIRQLKIQSCAGGLRYEARVSTAPDKSLVFDVTESVEELLRPLREEIAALQSQLAETFTSEEQAKAVECYRRIRDIIWSGPRGYGGPVAGGG